MKTSRALALFSAVLLAPACAGDVVCELSFIGGDSMKSVSGLTYDDGRLVVPEGGNLAEPAELRIDQIVDLLVEGGSRPQQQANHVVILELTNGDELRGQLEGVDPEHVTLSTWYGGTIRIKRSMCRTLQIQRLKPAIYTGPNALENWTTVKGEEAWSLRAGALVSNASGSIARQIALPERCRLGFKVEWKGSLKMRLQLLAGDTGDGSADNCYELMLQRRFLYLRKRMMSDNGGATNDNIGQPVNLPDLGVSDEAQIELFIDRKEGKFVLYVDGRHQQDWLDPEPAEGDFGNWLQIIADDEPFRISGIRASAWNGELPGDPEAAKIVSAPGYVTEVGVTDEGEFVIQTKDRERRHPAGTALILELTDVAAAELPLRRKGDVCAWWHDGGRLTFQLQALDGTSITGRSQTFGEHKFDLNAFSRIEFNLYNEELYQMRNRRR